MKQAILIRYSEIALKGKNRNMFEKDLVRNIKKQLGKDISYSIKRMRGRMRLYTTEIKKAVPLLQRVFGITSISPAIEIENDFELLKSTVMEIVKKENFKTFRVSSRRLKKELISSGELDRQIGAFVVEQTGKKVSLKNFDLEIGIEIIDYAYIYTKKIECYGGLPVGVEGRVIGLIDDKKSILASWLAMKRGCAVFPVSLKQTGMTDIEMLTKFGCRNDLRLIDSISDIDKIADEKNCRAVIVGQTLKECKYLPIETAILRPLVGYDDKEIESYFDKINAGK